MIPSSAWTQMLHHKGFRDAGDDFNDDDSANGKVWAAIEESYKQLFKVRTR